VGATFIFMKMAAANFCNRFTDGRAQRQTRVRRSQGQPSITTTQQNIALHNVYRPALRLGDRARLLCRHRGRPASGPRSDLQIRGRRMFGCCAGLSIRTNVSDCTAHRSLDSILHPGAQCPATVYDDKVEQRSAPW